MRVFKKILVAIVLVALCLWLFGGTLLQWAKPYINDYLKTFPESEYKYSEAESAYPQLVCQNSHANWGEQVRVTQSLDGEWDIAEGSLGEILPDLYPHRVTVPGFVTEAQPAFAKVGVPSKEREAFWYRTEFTAPADPSALAVLCLHKAKYGAKVWLNGEPLGTHHGAFSLSEYDLSEVIRYGQLNELVVRVGAEFTAIPEYVPIGQDSEKYAWYPGLWDSVSVVYAGQGSIVRTKVAADIDRDQVTTHTTVRNNGLEEAQFMVRQRVREWRSGVWVSEQVEKPLTLAAGEAATLTQEVPLPHATLWSPETPFLYLVQTTLLSGEIPTDDRATRFGMRKVEWKGGEHKGFYLNNKLYYLRGTNIALHRFFEDQQRGRLPWDEGWVRELLSGHMKDFHWNSFRFHVGRAPNFWYDLADEIGLIVADEFHIFAPVHLGFPGMPHSVNWSLKELEKEFIGWMQENWNHPSVGWWDASNENHNPLLYDVVPLVRDIDTTRAWESGSYRAADRPDDPLEEHPYKLNGTGFLNSNPRDYTLADFDEFSRQPPMSLGGIFSTWDGEGARDHAYVNNEYGWLWLTRDGGAATPIAKAAYDILAPGAELSAEERREIYAYVASELSGYWRAGRGYAGIQHFLYLGKCTGEDDIAEGADIDQPSFTCDNFVDIPSLTMEPRWAKWARQAFSPVMINIERWSPAFYSPEQRAVPVTLVNDTYLDQALTVKLIAADEAGRVLARSEPLNTVLPSLASRRIDLDFDIPSLERFVIYASIEGEFGDKPVFSRRKVGFVHPGVLAILPAEVSEAIGQ